jgi:hypothetical protein
MPVTMCIMSWVGNDIGETVVIYAHEEQYDTF